MKRLSRTQASYLLDRRLAPVVTISPGESLLVETEDSCSGRIRQPEDLEPARLDQIGAELGWFGPASLGNPVTGPIWVESAEPGDTLAVKIDHIECDRQGLTGFWPLPSRGMADWFTQAHLKIMPIENGQVIFSDRIRFPVRPMIGAIGTAPPLEARLSEASGTHGGNLDCPDICPGSTVYLPVFVPGALLFLGDVHAAMGDGEVSDGGIETRSETQITVDVIKGRPPGMTWPRVETPDALVTVANGAPLEVALRTALREMILWLEADFGLSRAEAFMLTGQIGDARPCQVVISPYTMRFRMPKAYLG